MRRIVLIPVMAALLAFAHPALAQYENRSLYDRIDRLERDLQMLQGQVSRGGSTVVTSPALGGGSRSSGGDTTSMSSGMANRLDERVDQLEEMVRQLTGRVEESNYRNQQMSKQMERMQADIDLRFKELQQGGGGAAPAPTPVPAEGNAPASGGSQILTPPKGANLGGNSASGTGPAPGPQSLGTLSDSKTAAAAPSTANMSSQQQYEAAYAAAQRGDYAAAEKGFQDFLAKNPNHQLAGNAQYWLGDIAYTRKDYRTAAAQFAEAYKKFPKHDKAPDMLYKLGSSFGQLNMQKEACKAFSLLFQEHPNMPDRVKRAATSEKQRYQCK